MLKFVGKMKRLFLIVTILGAALCTNAQSAAEVANAFLQNLEKKVLVADFTISLTDGVTQPLTYAGSLSMKGENFVLDMGDMQVAYDGSTMYTYMQDVEEITLTAPDREDLVESNPLLFAKALLKTSSIAFSKTEKRDGVWVIDFVPLNQAAGVLCFTLRVRKSDYMPLSITLLEEKNKTTKVTLSKQQYTTRVPAFTISVDGATINDIR